MAAPVAAAGLETAARPTLVVTDGGQHQVGDLLPGDQLRSQTVKVAASGSLRYRMEARTTGSPEPGRLVIVTVTAQPSGVVLFRGPLASAATAPVGQPAAWRVLTDATETLVVTGFLSRTVGNEIGSASLHVEWVVQAVEIGAP